ncbi:hypothetical protein JCGZ_04933 [Jatropha curcas]|uniref:Aminotransferase-like plant mobile domain-containing protein n=1 Tax=Jatropha curcas TaxID=180498 RepID=A0A067L6S7_JATCU|nr:hypothetical protein JCGZ_04933 [Jatropha curcas]
MTLTPADFTAITGFGFDGVAVPLDAWYQTAALGAELVGTLLGVPTRTKYTAQRYVYYENKGDPAVLACLRDLSLISTYDWASLVLAYLYHGLDVWAYEYRIYPGGLEGDTSTEDRRIPRYLAHRHHTYSSSEDPHYWRCYLNDRALADGERVLEIRVATTQRRVPAAPPHHMCILEGMTPEDRLREYDGFPADAYLIPGDYASYLTTRLQARLPEDRRRHRTPAFYRAQVEADVPVEPMGAVLGDVPFPRGMEVDLDCTLGLGPAIVFPADLRQAPPQLQQDPEHATHVSRKTNLLSQRYLPGGLFIECLSAFAGACSDISGAVLDVLLRSVLHCRLYPEHHDMELEIGRLQRHQSGQAAAVSRLQMEVDRLWTRLEVEGIPLVFSEEEDDDEDGSSSEDAPTPPPSSVRQAAAGPSRRRR